MNKNKLIFVVLLFTWIQSFSETFVIQKKNTRQKKMSLSRCKQNVCQSLVNQVSLIPSVQMEIAFIQQKIFKEIVGYVESSHTGFFAKATKKKLQKCDHICEKFNQAQVNYLKACKNFSQYLKTLT